MKQALMTMLVLLQIPLFVYPINRSEAAAEITPLSYYQDKNYRYFVGLMYYEMWKRTDGSWTDGGRKPNTGMRGDASFTYKFQFPGRKIKGVDAQIYNPNDPVNDPVEYFEKSRSDFYEDYQRAISFGITNSDIKPFRKQGIGTDATTIPITIDMLLNAQQPDNIKDVLCPSCAAEVEAYRIYVPILFKIELATQLNVKYFTTDGKSLNDIFTPIIDAEMNVGLNYPQLPPTTHKDYEYVGFKKSTTDNVPSGDIIQREPDMFKYDGTFEKYTLFMYYKKKEKEPCKPEEPGCGPPPTRSDCTDPVPASSLDGRVLDPMVTAVIKADQRGSERFDVSLGIPTSESLYGNVSSHNYLFENKFVKKTGKCTFKVNVEKNYTLKWDPGKTVTGSDGKPKQEPDPQTETETRVYSVTVERPYSFWTIDTLHIFKINEAYLSNYALLNGGIKITPSGYTQPSYSASTRGTYYPPNNPGTVTADPETKTGGKTKPSITDTESSVKPYAERAIDKVDVENDYLLFNGSTIMDNRRVKEDGPSPGRIPEPTLIGQNVLYSPGHVISSTKVNKANTASSGNIKFGLMSGNINGGSDKQFPINGINTVTVHTPVVNYSSITDDREHNQKTTPNYNHAALILDRPFTVRMPTNGQHVNYHGYGDRDYAKYFRMKQVWFPFDVYTADRSRFIPKRTWTDIPVNQLDTTFFLPVWVDEGDYMVLYRNIAENTPDSFTHQPTANTNWENHVATHEIAVEVIGRVYDFHVTDIMDFNWEPVFRKQKGSSEPTGNSYWVGSKGIDGEARGNALPYELPVRKGSHPDSSYKNVAVKTGYAFKFDLKTKGNMFGSGDGIHLKPTFYFTDSKGQKRQEVDVYYHTDERKFIRIGSAADKVRRSMEFNARLRNVPEQRIIDAAGAFYELFASSMSISHQAYIEEWARAAKKPTTVGSYSDLFLPYQVRTFMGPTSLPTGVSVARAFASIQQWYGEYNLPAKLYIVPKGFDLSKQFSFNDKAPFFLRDGFLIVNYDIETVRDGQKGKPHLQYIKAPLTNQWKREGSHSQFTDPYGITFQLRDGDVMFYRADQSSVDDFGVTGTH